MLFSVAPFSDVQLENGEIMLLKFHYDSWVVINSCFVSHSKVGLGDIIYYRYI
jgi:hypothetical protein